MKKLGGIGLLLLLAAGVWVNSLRPAPNVKAREAVGEKVTHYNDPYHITLYYSGPKDGSNIILLASAGREASDFNELVKELNSNGYKTVSIESHGINKSKILLENANLSNFGFHASYGLKLSTPEPVIIGHAYGNRIARQTASQHTNITKGVILLAAGGQVPPDPEAAAALKRIFNPLKSHRSRMKDVRTAFFAEGNEIPPHWKRGWHTQTAIAQGKAKGDGDESWHCAGGVPMLIVQPMQDKIAPPANAYALKEKCPQEVEIVEVQNAGHALLPEQPEAVAKAVLDFLTKHHPTETNK